MIEILKIVLKDIPYLILVVYAVGMLLEKHEILRTRWKLICFFVATIQSITYIIFLTLAFNNQMNVGRGNIDIHIRSLSILGIVLLVTINRLVKRGK